MRNLRISFVTMLLISTMLSGVARSDSPEITPPTLTRFVDAPLPTDTPRRNVDVQVQLTIDAQGAVSEVELLQGAGEPWDSAAVNACGQLGFAPARENGEAIAVRVPFTYQFRVPPRRGRFVAQRQARRAPQPPPGYQLRGQVLEKGTRSPLPGIAVTVRDPRTRQGPEVITGPDGEFLAQGLAPGEVEIIINTGEHERIQRSVRGVRTPEEGEPEPSQEPIEVYLDPVGVSEYQTVVKDRPRPQGATEISLTDDELTQVPGTFGDPTRVVASLPGVARTPFGLGYYVVRGAAFENTGFFIDGHPALYLYHLLGGPGIIPPELIGQLTFYPGGYPASYGRFATGAIVLDTTDPPDDRWHADVSIDLLKAAALVSVPLDDKKVLLTGSFRRSYYELFVPLFTDDFALSYTDYQFRASWRPSPDLRANFFVFGTEDMVRQSGESPQGGADNETGFSIGLHRFTATVEYDVQPELTLINSLAWEYDHTDSGRSSDDADAIDASASGWIVSIRSSALWKPNSTFLMEGGVDSLLAFLESEFHVPSFPPLGDPRPPTFDPVIVDALLDEALYSVAPYIRTDWDVGAGLRVLSGLRLVMDHYTGSPRWNVDPRLSIRWQVHDDWTVTAMGAMVHQPPPTLQTAEPFGDPTIPPVRGIQTSLGVEWEPGDGWEIKVEGFFNFLDNMSRPSDVVSTEDGKLERAYWAADMEGRAWGLELLIRKRFGGRFHGWLSYTLSHAQRLRPPNDWELYELDQTHVLNLAWTVQLGADWSIGARFSLSSGNPYYPITGSRYDADRDKYEPVYATERDRLDIFHRLDLRIDKRWRLDTWMLEAYLDIQNVYNASNPETQRYSYDYGIQTNGIGVPILPTLGVRAVF